jgi:hypothetical protein
VKKFAKRLSLLIAACALLVAIFFTGCGADKSANGEVVSANGEVVFASETRLVITIESAEEGATLKDAMRSMQEAGKLSFTTDGTGMIKAINSRSAGEREFWSLYTSNADYGDASFSITPDGQPTCYFSLFGCETLPVSAGETIVWDLSSW